MNRRFINVAVVPGILVGLVTGMGCPSVATQETTELESDGASGAREVADSVATGDTGVTSTAASTVVAGPAETPTTPANPVPTIDQLLEMLATGNVSDIWNQDWFDSDPTPAPEAPTPSPAPAPNAPAATLVLTSPAFQNDATIPVQYTADGAGISPALNWTGAPAGTQSYALIVDDPDAPMSDPFVHWVIFNIPGSAVSITENVPTSAEPAQPAGSRQGVNSFGAIGYGPPAPPQGDAPHRYQFTIYALDASLSLAAGVGKSDVLAAMQGHVLAQTTLVGRYGR